MGIWLKFVHSGGVGTHLAHKKDAAVLVRLGDGEYYETQEENIPAWVAQGYFLSAVARLYPEVLGDEVLPGKLGLTVWAERFHVNEPWVLEVA